MRISFGFAFGELATRIVCARSAAEIPVLTPLEASILTVKAVLLGAAFRLLSTIIGRFKRSHCSSVKLKQIKPRASLAIKLISCGRMLSAAMTMSPSFSRSSSSKRITILPKRISSIISAIVFMISKPLSVSFAKSDKNCVPYNLVQNTEAHPHCNRLNWFGAKFLG